MNLVLAQDSPQTNHFAGMCRECFKRIQRMSFLQLRIVNREIRAGVLYGDILRRLRVARNAVTN